jgi:hypothetical protein
MIGVVKPTLEEVVALLWAWVTKVLLGLENFWAKALQLIALPHCLAITLILCGQEEIE